VNEALLQLLPGRMEDGMRSLCLSWRARSEDVRRALLLGAQKTDAQPCMGTSFFAQQSLLQGGAGATSVGGLGSLHSSEGDTASARGWKEGWTTGMMGWGGHTRRCFAGAICRAALRQVI
jgi:hypothetical protein